MANERESLSPTQVGLGVLWPVCWTGLPIKLAFAVLIFSMGLLHVESRLGLDFLMLFASPVTVLAMPVISLVLDGEFGEGIGILLLFLLAIPIDIWAFGVVGRTFFLERFRKEPPFALGFTLWWKSVVVGAFFLPILWYVVSAVTATAISTSHSLAQMESLRHLFNTGLPIAERIGLEVTIWGTISFGILIVLVIIGVSTVGRIIRDISRTAEPSQDDYQRLITRWDLMRVPRDQGLFLTAVTGTGFVLCLIFWAALPLTTPHPHECCKPPEVKIQPPFKPMETLARNEQLMANLEAQVAVLEDRKAAEAADKQKTSGKADH